VTATGEASEATRCRLAWPVGADYGLTVLTGARAERAGRLVSFILSPAGQAILARHGFAAPTSPSG
jgi:molybdate transport system substrate-binding protein